MRYSSPELQLLVQWDNLVEVERAQWEFAKGGNDD